MFFGVCVPIIWSPRRRIISWIHPNLVINSFMWFPFHFNGRLAQVLQYWVQCHMKWMDGTMFCSFLLDKQSTVFRDMMNISYVFGSFSHPMSFLHVMHSSQFWLLTQKWCTWFHAFRTSKVYLNNGVKTCLAIWRKILWPMEMSVHLLATSGCTPSNLLGEGDLFMYKRIYVQILNLTQLQGFALASCLGMLARERACVTFCAICAELCWVLLLMYFCFGTFL